MNTTPEIEILIDRLVAFIKVNRGRKNFMYPGYDDNDLAMLLRQAILDKSLLYCTDEIGNIVGIVNGRVTNEKIFFVDHILTTRLNILPIFLNKFKEMFPGYTIYGTRYGKEKIYNTPTFIRKCRHFSTFRRN